MRYTKEEQAEIEALSRILTSEQMEAIEEQVANEKAAQRYRELLEKAADR